MTFDEGAHLYSGYQHWTARDFGVNPEHPPLVKLVAAMPLLDEDQTANSATIHVPPRAISGSGPDAGRKWQLSAPDSSTNSCQLLLWSFYTFRYAARPGDLALAPPLAAFVHMGPGPLEMNLIQHLAAWHLLPEAYLFAWTKLSTPFTVGSAFLFGKIYPTGTWMYFPAALLIKSSLTLLLLLAAVPFVLRRKQRESAILAIALITILVACLPSHTNIGVRHVLAIYPFAILLAAAAAWEIARKSRPVAATIAVLLLFLAASSLRAFPDYLPYANEAFGGSANTYHLLTYSNVDWGQQLKEVNQWVASHNITDCWFAYSYVDGTPVYDKTPCRPLPSGLSTLTGVPVPVVPTQIHGTLLIGAADAAGVLWGPGTLNPYQEFELGHPVGLIGNSTLIYQGDFDLPMVSAESHLSLGGDTASRGSTRSRLPGRQCRYRHRSHLRLRTSRSRRHIPSVAQVARGAAGLRLCHERRN